MRTTLVARIAAATAIPLICSAAPALAGTNSVTFTQVGEHPITVPSGVTSLHVVAIGGKGGTSSSNAPGGFGARVTGDLAVQPGAVRYLVVGGNGRNGDYAGGGGGASDVRTAPVSAGLSPTDPRLLVAGGGGGGGRGIVDSTTPPGGRGGDGGQPGHASRSGEGVTTPSGGGAAGVPTGTGAGGAAGSPTGLTGFGAAGTPGALGAGGTGAYPGGGGQPGTGGFNGGGLGGGYNTGYPVGNLYLGGGGGGGGLNGGGGGGGMGYLGGIAQGGGGGGGGSNLVPPGGAAATSTADAGSVTVSFEDAIAPVVSLPALPARAKGGRFPLSGTSGTVLGDGAVTIAVYAGTAAVGAPVWTSTPSRDASSGAWQESGLSLTDGTYTVRASQVDGAGNVGVSAARTVVIDWTPSAPTLASPAEGAMLTDAAPLFSGVAGTATGDAATVEVEVRKIGTTVVETVSGQRDGATGAYAVRAAPPLGDGTYRAVARQSDDVGNVGASPPVTFRIDTQPPAPTLVAPAAARSSDATPTFSGTGTTATDDADTVEVRIHAGASTSGAALRTLQATLDGVGAYVVEAAPLSDGVYTAQTVQRDAFGHVGRSAPRTFTVDTTAPTAPTVTLDAAHGAAAPALSTFSGSGGTAAGDDATVTVALHAGSSAAAPLVTTIVANRDGQSGAYTATAPFALAPGTYTAVATQRDDVGNAGASTARTFEVPAPSTDPPVVDPPPDLPPPTDPPILDLPPDLPPSTDPPVVVPPGAVDTTAPTLSRVGLSAQRFAVGGAKRAPAAGGKKLPSGTTVRYTLSEPATVTLAIARSGRARVVGTLTRRSPKGATRVAFSGRIGRKALPPGRYALTLRAVDAAGNRSAPRKVAFRIG